MGRELTVPHVFEPGVRVLSRDTGKLHVVLGHDGRWWGVSGLGYRFDDAPLALHFTVVAPAPRAGQRWESGGSEGGTCWVDREDPVEMARWLLANGYSYAGEVSPALPAPPPVASLEPLAPPRAPSAPATWTLADARRAILDAIADAAPRRPAAFTSALCSLAEADAPMLCTILAASAALTSLEEELPEHGAPAEWQALRARSRADEVFRVAAQLDHVPASVEGAFEIYLDRRSCA
ncbi:hypothetical protein WMF30_10980 [Sorangium sp. So ce134]